MKGERGPLLIVHLKTVKPHVRRKSRIFCKSQTLTKTGKDNGCGTARVTAFATLFKESNVMAAGKLLTTQ